MECAALAAAMKSPGCCIVENVRALQGNGSRRLERGARGADPDRGKAGVPARLEDKSRSRTIWPFVMVAGAVVNGAP